MNTRRASLLLGLSIGLLQAAPLSAAVLLPWNANWLYFDDGYEPDPEWFSTSYDDGAWDIGAGQFGYGDGDEETTIYFGPDDEHKFVTTYFRTYVHLSDPAQYASITLSLIRDDGVVVYVNGVEAARDNLPSGPLAHDTYALTGLTFPEENEPAVMNLSPALFVDGFNLIAVAVHQYEAASPDLSFDLQLAAGTSGGVTRGPYLQIGTSSNMVVRWRTESPTDTRVRFGTNLANLGFAVSSTALTTEHEITLTNLRPYTKYFYDIGTTTAKLAGDSSYHFTTAPLPGTRQPVRVWAIGDFGTGFPAQHAVRDAYGNFTGSRGTDVWLMLGDNAYYYGFDDEFQSHCFEMYPTFFRQTVAWPTMGNHETGFGSQEYSDDYDYYRNFTLPTAGHAGGVPSGTEHYYSFNYGNVHFVCLDSMTASFRQPTGAMAQWLETDLADNTQDWIVAYFHHPIYSRGSHNTDVDFESIQMRQNILPILEAHGVDVILAGHSHSYERSYFLNGHYGASSTFNSGHLINGGDGRTNGTGPYVKPAGAAGANRGMIHIVDGSSGGQGGGGTLNHPAKYYSTLTYGSVILDFNGLRLDASFLSSAGTVDDTFTIIKEEPPALNIARAGTNAVVSWPASLLNYQLQRNTNAASTNWVPAPGVVSNYPGGRAVNITTTNNSQFFRLRSTP